MNHSLYRVPNATWPNYELAGEFYYESAIRPLLGHLILDQDKELLTEASLVPEPDNPYDPNAVSIRIGGAVVGYLERDDAREFAPVVHRLAASGVHIATSARVWGVLRESWEGTGTRFHSNVRVALPEPHLLLPLNQAPAMPYSILPWGPGLQVTGEQKHFDVLAPFAGKAERSLLLVTLHRGSEEKARGGVREFIEVRVDDQRIGEMSTQSSKHYFALVDHHQAKGLLVVGWAHVRGSALAAEVVLQAAKASEIDNRYLQGPPVTLPTLVPISSNYDVPAAYTGPARTPRKNQPQQQPTTNDRPVAAEVTSAPVAKSGCAIIAVGVLALVGGLVGIAHQLMV